MAKANDFLKCPKCEKNFMLKSVPQKFGKEYFCHRCHTYFGVNELVNQWGYDAGDLYPYYPVTHASYKNWITKEQVKFFGEFSNGEPNWDTKEERSDAYEMVNRMIMGIPEYDDYLDLMNTQNDAMQIGVQ